MEKLIISQVVSDRAVLDAERLIKAIELEDGSYEEKSMDRMLAKAKNIRLKTIDDKMINDRIAYYLIKDKRAKPIGYFCFYISQGVGPLHKFLLIEICFRLEHCGKRYGTRVLKYIENLAMEKECQWISVYINEENAGAINFFEKNGFLNALSPKIVKTDKKIIRYCLMEKGLAEIYYKKLKRQRN